MLYPLQVLIFFKNLPDKTIDMQWDGLRKVHLIRLYHLQVFDKN